MNRTEYLSLVRRARDILFVIPGVFAVGLGNKLTGGRDTGQLALNVMVREKKPLAVLSPAEVIPAEIEGVPTDVEEGDPPNLIAVDPFCRDFDPGVQADTLPHRPILGGIRIRGARSMDLERKPAFGTLGCFATTTGKDAGKRVLLTNYHVLADPINELHGPSCTGCTKGDSVGNPNSVDRVATILRGRDDDQLDAAIAVLDAGVKFEQDIFKDDELPTPREAIRGARPPLDPNNPADQNFEVHKRGHRTRITYGTVRIFGASVTVDGKEKHNQIRIDLPNRLQQVATTTFAADGTISSPTVDFIAARVEVNDLVWVEGAVPLGPFRITTVRQNEVVVAGSPPASTAQVTLIVTRPHFALSGDSGSVLLDQQGRVVGLVWAAFCRRRIGSAWANAIDVVERELRIKIDTASAIGDTQIAQLVAGDTPAIAVDDAGRARPAAAASGTDAIVTLRERVEDDLLPSPHGREIYNLYFRHHLEVRELLDTNRRVAVVWHRQGGPSIIQSVLDAVRSGESAIPSAVRGKTWAERVTAILAVFAEHGSARLRDDIALFGDEVGRLGGMTYAGFLAALGV